MSGRPLQNFDAENNVLGSILIGGSPAASQVVDILEPRDFYEQQNGVLYAYLIELDEARIPLDVTTVYEQGLKNGRTMELSWLWSLANNSTGSANIRAYAKIVKNYSAVRQLVRVKDTIDLVTGEAGREVDDMVSEVQRALSEVGLMTGSTGAVPLEAGIGDMIDAIDAGQKEDQHIRGISTGYPDLDRKLGGLRPGQMIVIAGRPSMGKSALALNIAEHVGLRDAKPVLIYSLEMEREELLYRTVSSLGSVPLQSMVTYSVTEEDWPALGRAAGDVKRSNIYVDDSPGLTIQQIHARARQERHKIGGLSLIIVDYMQLMEAHNLRLSRAEQLAEVSRGLKLLAKELQCPVVALSQLNRKVEERADKHPILSDLKESGAIEQDADVIVFIYRDVIYNNLSPHKNIAEIMIAKQRMGPIGTVPMYYQGEYTRFAQMTVDAQQEFWSHVSSAKGRRTKRGLDDD